jgi:hypothetical protein
MIGLILLENISPFQMYCLYAKYQEYIARLQDNSYPDNCKYVYSDSSLKRKMGISHLYIHGVMNDIPANKHQSRACSVYHLKRSMNHVPGVFIT